MQRFEHLIAWLQTMTVGSFVSRCFERWYKGYVISAKMIVKNGNVICMTMYLFNKVLIKNIFDLIRK